MYIALNKFEISQFIDKYWGKLVIKKTTVNYAMHNLRWFIKL